MWQSLEQQSYMDESDGGRPRSGGVWRPVLLVFCALAALAQVMDTLSSSGAGGSPPWRGRWGFVSTPSSTPYCLAVTAVDPGSPADVAGLHRGDLIDIRTTTLLERLSLFAAPLDRRPVVLSVLRGSLTERIAFVPKPRPYLRWTFWAGAFGGLWLLLFAALIAWRRAANPQMRLLSLWLAVFVLTGATINVVAPWAWAYAVLAFVNSAAGPLAIALLASFASGFAQPLSRVRRIAQWTCFALVAIACAILEIGTAGIISLQFDPLAIADNVLWTVVGAAVCSAASCGALAMAAARGNERQRAIWTLAPLAIFFLYFVAAATASARLPSYATLDVLALIETLVFLTVPIALTYAALSRRLLDIGFVLNRAAVFTIVSIVVVGLFTLGEWALGGWLQSANRVTNVAVSAALALALGLSLHQIHTRVDRVVDNVFFRKRHDDERALQRFAREASYMTDAQTMLARAAATLETHADCASVEFFIHDGAATYGGIDENDAALVTLRSSREVVDLHTVDTELHGEFAYPMLARGRLVGALVLGCKRSGESYAPDESHAIAQVAHGVGVALDLLGVQHAGSPAAFLDAIRALEQSNRAIATQLGALPDAIAERLRQDRATI